MEMNEASSGSKNAEPASNWTKMRHACTINKKLLPMKTHFFFFFGGLAGVIPPLVLYSKQLGASESMVGVLFAVLPFVQCVSKPCAGIIADKWQQHKAVFITSMIILTTTLFSINFIPESQPDDLHFIENLTLISCNGKFRFSACPSFNYYKYDAIKLQRISCNLSNCNIPDDARQSVSFLFDKEITDYSCLLKENVNCVSTNSSSIYSSIGLEASLSSYENFTNVNASLCPEFDVRSMNMSSNRSIEFRIMAFNESRCSQSSFTCAANCSAMAITKDKEKNSDTFGYEMIWLWTGCIVAWSAYSIILSISDAILMNTLGENRSAFGYTRLYSSVGWGLMSAISAKIIDYASTGRAKKDFSPGFYIFFGFMICDIVTAVKMKVVIFEKPHALAKDLCNIFKRAEVLIFCLAVLIQGMVTGFLWTFVIVYADELNGTQLVIGLNYAVECFLSEIPFFMASGWIVKKLGYSNSLSLVLLVTGCKTLSYSFIYNAWYMLIIALAHGVTYGVMYSTLATYASVIAPPSVSASVQGIFQALLEGAGVGLGNLLGGFTYEGLGGRKAFQAFGSALIIISAVHWSITFSLKMLKSRTVSPEIVLHSTNVTDEFVDVVLESKPPPTNQTNCIQNSL